MEEQKPIQENKQDGRKKKSILDQIKDQPFFENLRTENEEWGINYQVVGTVIAGVVAIFLMHKHLPQPK